MSWLLRHIDCVLVGVALGLSAVWISGYIVHPLTQRPPLAVINDGYVSPRAPLARPFIPRPPMLS